MIKFSWLLFFLLFSTSEIFCQTELKVMSYNIRYDAPNDGENLWDIRKSKLASLMAYYDADFIGTQEVKQRQLEFLLQHLPSYSYAGVARTDGKKEGEYSAILYNKEKYKLIEQSTFWLSLTPTVPSKNWDAAIERICTYGLFQHVASKKFVWILNTHFDHIGKESRFRAAGMIVEKIKELKKKRDCPVVFMGDLNATPEENTIELLNQHLRDARHVSKLPAYGPENTWNAFEFTKKPDGRIDYVFVEDNDRTRVSRFITIDDFYDFKYPSDHLPVMAHIQIK
jgi:endonuclease/exonuclease/phosphatase family metal-dependent hydrolase